MGKPLLIVILLLLVLICSVVWLGNQVLSNGDESYFEGKDYWETVAATNFNQPDNKTNLKVRAYPLKAVTSRQAEQTIYVVVQDQTYLPVEGAEVSLVMQMPNGDELRYIINNPTNDLGVTETTFPVSTSEVGLVLVTVNATRDRSEATTSTSFRIWW